MVPFRSRTFLRGFAGIALVAAVTAAHAQAAAAHGERRDPLDPQARVPAVTYRSPFASYRRLGDDKSIPWREANETVNRVGGWRAYAREAQQPDGGAPEGAAAPAAPASSAPGRQAPGASPMHGPGVHKTH